jgi:glucose-6-phosphate 1-epimerase
MGNKANLIILWAMLVAVVAMATHPPPFERTKGINGLEKLIVRDRRGRSFEVYLYGGQVTSWKNEKGDELLFMSTKAIFEPPTPIRGGIPLLFPQYSNTGPLPSHGFVRQRFWEIDTSPPPLPSHPYSSAHVDLILKSSDADLKIWPNKFVYRLRVALGHGGDLTLTSRVKNSDVKPFNFTAGLHPYFYVSDISQIQVEGLQNLDYLDQQKNRTRFTDHAKFITFNSQLDRLYLRTPSKLRIVDHNKKKTIVVRKEGYADAVVWNPWDKKVSDLGVEDYKRFVAVEPVAVEKPIILKPGQVWKGVLQVSVVPRT